MKGWRCSWVWEMKKGDSCHPFIDSDEADKFTRKG